MNDEIKFKPDGANGYKIVIKKDGGDSVIGEAYELERAELFASSEEMFDILNFAFVSLVFSADPTLVLIRERIDSLIARINANNRYER